MIRWWRGVEPFGLTGLPGQRFFTCSAKAVPGSFCVKEPVPILDSVPCSDCTIEEKTTIPIVLPHTGTPVTSDLTWLRLVVKRQHQKCQIRP
ncbi:hypothetical protein AV530_004757 [Patagioenas fasciata monilis]|uniref:Uncharacterized protein n=1 Tax=Patagioenas fasciata monilis TaxID=372326 RepID=A0A1V4KFI6_PATFA|nr:hypothetical protein AV530_004757 [Patagioenas fasciata monilis]